MSNWLEHSVQIKVDAPIDVVWNLWSDLEKMPQWMKWIDSVTVLADDPDLSRWKLASLVSLNYNNIKLFNGNL